ncbi:UNVERIFIED_CONTAM: hypothetical protein FKN15_048242 [Acipenser sinensis]
MARKPWKVKEELEEAAAKANTPPLLGWMSAREETGPGGWLREQFAAAEESRAGASSKNRASASSGDSEDPGFRWNQQLGDILSAARDSGKDVRLE